MSVQLTIRQPGSTQEALFRPAALYEFEQSPILLGGPQGSCPIPETSQPVGRITVENETYVLESLVSDSAVQYHSKTLKKHEKQVLRSGDCFTLCGCPVTFYLNYPKTGVSWQSNTLAGLAKFGIGLILVLQVFCIFVLPNFLKKGQYWSGQQMRLNIIFKTDQLRKQLHSIKNPDPLVQLITKEYQQELLQRTAYLREYSEVLTRSQRKNMLQALTDLEEQIPFLEKARIASTLPQLQINRPVAEIIEKTKHE
ncbi:MAG: hypothetical protein WCT05_00205 [Lentisphaeria bacterium]